MVFEKYLTSHGNFLNQDLCRLNQLIACLVLYGLARCLMLGGDWLGRNHHLIWLDARNRHYVVQPSVLSL